MSGTRDDPRGEEPRCGEPSADERCGGVSPPDERVELLWRALASSVRVWLERRTGDPHVAEDLLSECFLRVHDRLDEAPEGERLGAWVWRIAQNLVVDWRRRAGRELAGAGAPDPDALGDPAADPASLPESEDATVAAWLAPAIATLEPRDRETLELTELAGLPQREAAERLGVSLAALKARVLRARARLRERILACCALELDRRGGIVAYRERSSNCCSTSEFQDQTRSGSSSAGPPRRSSAARRTSR